MNISGAVEETLKGLGLGKNDIRVYLGLLQEGKSPAVVIARVSGVHRVNVYDALRVLEEQGLVSVVIVAGKKMYQASAPESLTRILKEREAKLAQILPQLSMRFEKTENKSQNFEGLDAIKRMLEDMIKEGKPICAFGIPRKMPELLSGYLATWHRQRIEKHIPIDHIYNENAQGRIAYLNTLRDCRAKYLPPEYSVPATTVIYGDKVTFWIWSAIPFVVLIESKTMADAYRTYFKLLWSLAKV
jgi:sugar-specific transcriptional regulator TrmB